MNNKTQIKLIFSIFGKEFNPIDFTKYIGIEPSEFWFFGDSILNRTELFRKESSWNYSIGFVETLFFEELSKSYLNIFQNKMEDIKKFMDLNKLNAKIYIIIEMAEEETPAIYFDRFFLNTLDRLDAEIDMDFYK